MSSRRRAKRAARHRAVGHPRGSPRAGQPSGERRRPLVRAEWDRDVGARSWGRASYSRASRPLFAGRDRRRTFGVPHRKTLPATDLNTDPVTYLLQQGQHRSNYWFAEGPDMKMGGGPKGLNGARPAISFHASAIATVAESGEARGAARCSAPPSPASSSWRVNGQ